MYGRQWSNLPSLDNRVARAMSSHREVLIAMPQVLQVQPRATSSSIVRGESVCDYTPRHRLRHHQAVCRACQTLVPAPRQCVDTVKFQGSFWCVWWSQIWVLPINRKVYRGTHWPLPHQPQHRLALAAQSDARGRQHREKLTGLHGVTGLNGLELPEKFWQKDEFGAKGESGQKRLRES